MQQQRASLGYREVILKEDCLFGSAGTVLHGHEFHYSAIANTPENNESDINLPHNIHKIYTANDNTGSTSGTEGYSYKNVLGGYIHLHFGFNFQAVETFIEQCKTLTA
jgi:cobyrinic acid a,c-diamide synthase